MMRYKPYFVERHKPNLGFLKRKKRQKRKKRLRLKLGKLKAIRIKSKDSAVRKMLCALILASTILSLVFHPVFYLTIAIIGICFFLACCKALFYKEEKHFSVIKTNKKGDSK